MDFLDFCYFFKQLEAGISIDENCFYFIDDPLQEEHYFGFSLNYELPYWVGYCDILGGCNFHTAEELVNAKIFNRKSLKERWLNVRIISMCGINLDEWLSSFPHV